MDERRLLSIIILVFIILGVIYSWVTPLFEASDELWHYPMIRHLANGNPLPVQVLDPAQAGPWKQEASQPPLYYYLAAGLTYWIDTSDFAQVRQLNPHVDNGRITADGNVNLIVHDPELGCCTGTALAVRIVRLFSVLLGAFTVYLTYLIASEVEPHRTEIKLGAAALTAFLPMFVFISGAVNNDNLVIPLASLALLKIIRLYRKNESLRRLDLLLLGVVIGLGALTKITALGLLPLAAGTLVLRAWRDLEFRLKVQSLTAALYKAAIQFVLLLVPAILIAGWWYFRNYDLYGDWTGWNAFIAVLGQRARPAGLAQLWGERHGFMMSYWGLFGGLNVPMWIGIYSILNIAAVFGVGGLLIGLTKYAYDAWSDGRIGAALSEPLRSIIGLIDRNFSVMALALWTTAVVVGLIRWATVTWSSQGRLVFSALPAISTLFALGLGSWLPVKLSRWPILLLALLLLLLTGAAPWLWIRPAYMVDERAKSNLRIVNVTFEDQMRITGVDITDEEIRPGDEIGVSIQWEALQDISNDWSVFVHLSDPVSMLPIAQRDMYPGQGLVATSFLNTGDRLRDRYVLEVPETSFSPVELNIEIGLYDYTSGNRLNVLGTESDSATIGHVSLKPRAGAVPNPVSIDFEDELQLEGFSLSTRRLAAGDELALTLYWQAQRSLEVDYTFFAQILGTDTTRWASHDLTLSTTDWKVGRTERVGLNLELETGTPAGVYPLIVGVYTRTEDGGFDRLQTVTDQGRLTDDFLRLTQLRVD